jgi:NADH-quinone oxidoreductase subunit G
MIKLTINNQIIDVEDGSTILQACEELGIEVPIFCYHPRLSAAGNCRMCLVEVDKSSKPVASCSMPAVDGMVVRTDSPMVEKSRKGNLEFLLINHPLDCPICDQGGECDLQDITMAYGSGESRFDLNKRAVNDKYMGPLIKTVMTRCIHCTRCVRFADEIAGSPELGTTGRGEHMEITSYLENAISSELSGNMIDLCPVGALTNKPYAFHGRSWELTKTESIDVMDAVGSNIRIDSRDREVMRILPRLNEDINEEWISDRTRFAYDGLKRQRLDQPYKRVDGKLKPCTWDEAFSTIKEKLKEVKGSEIAALTGDLVDCESMFSLKKLMLALGCPNIDCRQDGALLSTLSRTHYVMNTPIAKIEESDCILLIGTNPRHEAPLVNARIRKRYLHGNLSIGLVGEPVDLTYKYTHLSETPDILDFFQNLSLSSSDLFRGSRDSRNECENDNAGKVGFERTLLSELSKDKHPFTEDLKKATRPMLILGQAVFKRPDTEAILEVIQQLIKRYRFIQDDWNGFNVLHTAAARVGGLDLGFVPQKNGLSTKEILKACQKNKIKLVYLLGADEIPMDQLGSAFVIYQGHHGDAGAHRADVILPGAAYTEKTATYVNTEGRAQTAQQALTPPGSAKEDWKIIRALSEVIGHTLPYNTWKDIESALIEAHPAFASKGQIVTSEWQDFNIEINNAGIEAKPFNLPITNFYMADTISRHSANMVSCVQEILQGKRPHV